MGAAVEEEKNPAEEGKNLSEEVDKNPAKVDNKNPAG
jgi:hypothetical protein